jgi:hypothetical protein
VQTLLTPLIKILMDEFIINLVENKQQQQQQHA